MLKYKRKISISRSLFIWTIIPISIRYNLWNSLEMNVVICSFQLTSFIMTVWRHVLNIWWGYDDQDPLFNLMKNIWKNFVMDIVYGFHVLFLEEKTIVWLHVIWVNMRTINSVERILEPLLWCNKFCYLIFCSAAAGMHRGCARCSENGTAPSYDQLIW